MTRYRFDIKPLYQPFLLALGVTPKTAWADLGPEGLDARFGWWRLRTPLENISGWERSGPYRAYRAIGPRMSGTDFGLTFGSSTRGGVCLKFHQPVPGLLPFDRPAHPGLTLTVADADAFVDELRTLLGQHA